MPLVFSVAADLLPLLQSVSPVLPMLDPVLLGNGRHVEFPAVIDVGCSLPGHYWLVPVRGDYTGRWAVHWWPEYQRSAFLREVPDPSAIVGLYSSHGGQAVLDFIDTHGDVLQQLGF